MNARQIRSFDRSSDSLRMRDMGNRISSLHMRGNRQGMGPFVMPRTRGIQPDQMRGIRGVRQGMSPFEMGRMRNMRPGQMKGMRGFRQMPQFDMRRGPGRIPMDRTSRSFMGRNRRGNDSIPSLTEEQKKEITDLRKQQQDEMKKLRDEMSEKIQTLREKQRSMLLDQLTDEQKKAFESGFGRTHQSPAPARKK